MSNSDVVDLMLDVPVRMLGETSLGMVRRARLQVTGDNELCETLDMLENILLWENLISQREPASIRTRLVIFLSVCKFRCLNCLPPYDSTPDAGLVRVRGLPECIQI